MEKKSVDLSCVVVVRMMLLLRPWPKHKSRKTRLCTIARRQMYVQLIKKETLGNKPHNFLPMIDVKVYFKTFLKGLSSSHPSLSTLFLSNIRYKHLLSASVRYYCYYYYGVWCLLGLFLLHCSIAFILSFPFSLIFPSGKKKKKRVRESVTACTAPFLAPDPFCHQLLPPSRLLLCI